MIEYGQEMPQPTHGTTSKRHEVGLVQALTVQYILRDFRNAPPAKMLIYCQKDIF